MTLLLLCFRGVAPHDSDTTVYIHTSVGSSSSSTPSKIIKYSDFRFGLTPEELFTDAFDFKLVNEFLFATKRGVCFVFKFY